MANGRGLKRKLHRVNEEVKATFEIAKYTSIWRALGTFRAKIDIQKLVRSAGGGYEPLKVTNRLLKKHKTMLDYLEKKYAEFFQNYDYKSAIEDDGLSNHRIVWVYWDQGIENAPQIVKICVASIEKNCKSHKLILLSRDNYKEYAHIPDWVEEKKNKGIISRTHFSDLLRVTLLAEHGGVWLDSTFFCTSPDAEKYFDLPIWSIKRPEYNHYSVACGYFANYSFGCSYENRRAFATIRDFILMWWRNNDYLIDYLLTDYLVVLAQRYDKNIKELFESIPANNPRCDDLLNSLGEPYDVERWNAMKENTYLFKLTWKLNYDLQKDGKDTFYCKLMRENL